MNYPNSGGKRQKLKATLAEKRERIVRLKVTITFFIKNCEMYIQNPKKKIDIVKRKLTVLREKDRGKLIHFECFFFYL